MNPELGVITEDLIGEKVARFNRLSRMDMVLGALLKEINETERLVDRRWLTNRALAQTLIRKSIFVLIQDIERLGTEPDKEEVRAGVQATRLFIEHGVVASIYLTPSPRNHQELNWLCSNLTTIDYANDPKMRGRQF